MNLDLFTHAYITAALWSSTDDDGEPLDKGRDAEDIAPETLARMRVDCEAFMTANADDLAAYTRHTDYGMRWPTAELAGHDFWLTRNRHGAGFWDRGLPKELGERLTQAAQAMGECDLYIGDDGKVHM
jgi:hypothetical protein